MFLLLTVAPNSDCKKVEDREKRGFDDLRPILIDVDADGKADTILPHVFKSKANRRGSSGKTPKETNWIAFDLTTSKGRVLKSFFRYEYGDNLAEYWVYALVSCDVNNDGTVDLVFYAGDDSTDETIVLLNRGSKFVVHSRKKSKSDLSDL
jgi:hypothetical protein